MQVCHHSVFAFMAYIKTISFYFFKSKSPILHTSLNHRFYSSLVGRLGKNVVHFLWTFVIEVHAILLPAREIWNWTVFAVLITNLVLVFHQANVITPPSPSSCQLKMSLSVQHSYLISGRSRLQISFSETEYPKVFPVIFHISCRQVGHAMAQFVEALRYKPAGSIPDGVAGIFHWHNPSGRTMVLGLTQKWTLPSSCADCLEIWASQPPGTLRSCPGL